MKSLYELMVESWRTDFHKNCSPEGILACCNESEYIAWQFNRLSRDQYTQLLSDTLEEYLAQTQTARGAEHG